jgi:toxin ParE1/3/4
VLDIEFHPDVTKEIKSSFKWYQNQTDGLGLDYLSELECSF